MTDVYMSDVYAGEVKVPDIMFPRGSPHLVEPIYKNPKLTAPFNEQLTAVIRDYIEHRLPSLAPGEKVLCELEKAALLCIGSPDI